jgi:hypothetical protein
MACMRVEACRIVVCDACTAGMRAHGRPASLLELELELVLVPVLLVICGWGSASGPWLIGNPSEREASAGCKSHRAMVLKGN